MTETVKVSERINNRDRHQYFAIQLILILEKKYGKNTVVPMVPSSTEMEFNCTINGYDISFDDLADYMSEIVDRNLERNTREFLKDKLSVSNYLRMEALEEAFKEFRRSILEDVGLEPREDDW